MHDVRLATDGGTSLGGARRSRAAGVLALLVVPMFAMFATNADPASADVGLVTWAKVGLGAAAAAVSTTVNAAAAVSEVALVGASSVVSAGGAAVASGAVSTVSAAELAAMEASYALPAVGSVAAGVGVCAGTAGVACAVGGAVALAAGSYALYRFFGSAPGACTGCPLPNADVVAGPAPVAGALPFAHVAYNKTNPSDWYETTTFDQASMPYTAPAGLHLVRREQQVCADGYYTATSYTSYNTTIGAGFTDSHDLYCQPHAVVSYVVDWYQTSNADNTPGGGVPAASPAPTGAPSRQLVTTRHCVTAGNVVTTVTGTGASYVEGADVAAVAALPLCPAGTSVKDTQTISHTLDGTAPDKSVTNYTAPASVTPGTDPAPVVLYQVQPDGSYQTCEQTPSPCAGWWQDPTKTDRYQCRQGAAVLALSECDGIANRYNPKTPVDNPPGCFQGMGLSPLTWVRGLVLSPLRCLFIPSDAAVQAASSSISNAWSGTAPQVIFSAASGVIAPIVALKDKGPGSCGGPVITIPQLAKMKSTVQFQPFSTCHPFVQSVLGWYLPIASGMVYLGCFFAGSRTIMRTIGADGLVDT